VLESPQANPTARLTYGFNLCFARSPNPKELQLLQDAYQTQLAEFKANPESAKQLLAVGQSSANDQIPSVELAAWSSVARILLNLSEFITRP